jgi:hypothetical protein
MVFCDLFLQIFYCDRHDLFTLAHSDKAYHVEVYVAEDMLELFDDISEEQLQHAKDNKIACHCFPWVIFLFCCFLFFSFFLMRFFSD